MSRRMKLVAGMGLIVILGWLVDWPEAFAAVRTADASWVGAALGVSIVGVLISAGKWRTLLHRCRIGVDFAEAARLYWIGMFFSNFLPSSVGGDAVRLALTPSHGRTERVASSIVVERLTGLLVMLGLCLAGLILRHQYFAALGGLHAPMLAGVGALTAAACLLLFAPGPLAGVMGRLVPYAPRPLRGVARKLQAVTLAIAAQRRNGRGLLQALLLSFPFYGTIVLAQFCVLRAVNVDLPLVDVLLVGPLVPLLTILPISLNGIGVAEGAFVGIYAALGAAPELALAAAVLRRLVDLANSALGGLFWLGHRGAPAAASVRGVPATA